MRIVRLAGYGIAAALGVAVAVAGIGYATFMGGMSRDVARLAAAAEPAGVVVTEAMIEGLPAPAQRYFRHAGVVGQAVPRTVRLTQQGRIRASAEVKWMAFEADEVYSTNPPGFVWRAYFPTAAMPVALGRDEYLDGRGSIVMKMLALVPLADEQGDELAAAGLMRYLNEAAWFPSAYLMPGVAITPVDDSSFGVRITDRGMTAEAVIFVDAEGRMLNFRAQRYNTSMRAMARWETPMTAWGALAGLDLPTSGAAVWALPDGDLNYIELEVKSVSYEY